MITDHAFILHKRAYKDSSELIKLLTHHHGIIDVIAKGSQRPKSKLNGQLQPFIATELSWVGKSNLKTLINAEQNAVLQRCAYKNHVSMLYCNELLSLVKIDDHTSHLLFLVYQKAIKALQESASVRLVLRYFEWRLCCELGYELQLPDKAVDNDCIEFNPTDGLIINNTRQKFDNKPCTAESFKLFIGSKPMSFEQLNQVSNLMRVVINHLVNGKTIQSRQLLKIMNR